MSDTEKTAEIENNVQAKTPTKSSKRLSSFERARVESEEIIKAMGGSLEGGRQTRSSTRPPPATPSPTPKRARTSAPRRGRKAKQEEEEEEDEVDHAGEKPQPTQTEKSSESPAETAKSVENNTDDNQSVAKKDESEKMDVDTENTSQENTASTAEAKSTVVIQPATDALPTVVIQPTDGAKPTVVIQPKNPDKPAVVLEPTVVNVQPPVDSVKMDISDEVTPAKENKKGSISTSATAPAVTESRPTPPDVPVSEPAPQPALLKPAAAPRPIPPSAEVKTNAANVQVNNPPVTNTIANNVQPHVVSANDVQPSESVPVTEENFQKIQKPIVSQSTPAVVAESEPTIGHTTLVQVTASAETPSVPDDLTTTARNGNDVCNNVQSFNNEETVKILAQQSVKPSEPITHIL